MASTDKLEDASSNTLLFCTQVSGLRCIKHCPRLVILTSMSICHYMEGPINKDFLFVDIPLGRTGLSAGYLNIISANVE